MCDNRNLHQIKGSRVTRIQADGGGEFTNKKIQDGVVIKGLAPRRLDPCRYQLTAGPTLDDLEKNTPWRSIQDEFGKFKWLDHTGKIYQGTPFSVEPDITSKQMFVASMMHSSSHPPVLKDTPDVTCPSDVPIDKQRKEVVQYEQPSVSHDRKSKRSHPSDKKTDIVIKAKSIPVSPKTVASSQGAMREKWLESIYKEIENFLQNMAIDDADHSLVLQWKSKGKWPLPCQMVFVLKPLTQSQQQGSDIHDEYKHKSRMVICGNFATWGEHSTTTTNLDAPLLRLMLSLACSKETTWSSVDITSAFLNVDIHDEDTVLITPPPTLVKMDIVKPNTVWHVKKGDKHHVYGNKSATSSYVNLNSCTMTEVLTLFKATFIQAYGSLLKVLEIPHRESLHLTVAFGVMNGQPIYTSTRS